MQIIYNRIFLEHKTNSHPECPERLLAFGDLEQSEIENGEKYLRLVYNEEYTKKIKNDSKQGLNLDADTYTNSKSYEVACYAAGFKYYHLKQPKQPNTPKSIPGLERALQGKTCFPSL